MIAAIVYPSIVVRPAQVHTLNALLDMGSLQALLEKYDIAIGTGMLPEGDSVKGDNVTYSKAQKKTLYVLSAKLDSAATTLVE